jgi:hypothetical protein
MTALDRPRLRASCSCPLCGSPKTPGLLVCWPCFRYFKLEEFSEATEYSLDMAEEALTAEAELADLRAWAREKGEAEDYPYGYEWDYDIERNRI